MKAVLFEGEDLILRYENRSESSPLFVTFSHFGEFSEGFGEVALRKMGLSSLTFVARSNHWWQTREMYEALFAARAITQSRRYPEKIGYGSSMGGYGAILFADQLGLTKVVALSPQFSIDPEKVPFEERYRPYSETLTFLHDNELGKFRSNAAIYLLYDPADPDARHAQLFGSGENITRIPVAFAGHPVGHLLSQVGLLKDLIRSFGDCSFEANAYRMSVRDARKRSSRYLLQVAKRFYRRKQYARSIKFCSMARL